MNTGPYRDSSSARGEMAASVLCGTLRTKRPQSRRPLRRQRRSRRKLAAEYSCGALRCTARTRFESISGLAHQWRSLSPCGAISVRRSVLPAGMRVAHRNNGKERHGHRHSQDNRICNPIPHALAAFLSQCGAIRWGSVLDGSPRTKGRSALSQTRQRSTRRCESTCSPAYHSRGRAGVKAA